MNTKLNLVMTGKALRLIRSKASTQTILERLTWMKEALALLGQYGTKPVQPIQEPSGPDYDYLQSVINREFSNMNDIEIGKNLTDILNRNAENPSFISYVRQAIATYREAMIAASKQFIWGTA